MNYYLFAGPTMTDVAEAYTTLTGTTPLPQKWTLGYQQSRFSYASEKVVRDLAAKMRALNIPCDAIHLDIDYMDGFRVFTADPERFPQMKGMIADLKQQGIKVVTIIDPGVKVDKQYAIYEDGLAKHAFATNPDGTPYVNTVWPGKAVYPDFGNPAVRTWWGQNQQFLTDLGVAGVWNDMNEPAGFDGPIPDDTVFSDNGQPSTALAMHNVFGQNMAHATYDGLKKLTGKRPFVISRAVYAGAQRYTTVWTGDNRSTWAHLRLALPQLCSLGLSGIPFAGTDIGGFTSDTTAELMTRWLEAALFSPLLRNHSTARSRLQEPWAFGEPTLSIYRKFVELRYHLLDLLYDLFALQPSLPIMRPLVLHYQDDARVQTLNDEYLVGESLLVAPVVEQGATQRLVYLPTGDWIDFWTGKTVAGGQSIVVDAPLDHLPLFVKAGSLLPWRPLTQSVDVATETTLTFRCYGKAGVYTHYQDDGEDLAYQNGAYNLYEVRFDGDQASVELTRQGYPHPYRKITVETAGQDHVFYYVPEARAYRE
ncbi:glycoside hydrolase family 31 protein [Lacticaseibacillus yichunensis]|uniref:TIM-barrel domain-containing protein n=1 Tax=Lacticaseibacillus yichunensis TaxID=2486015 RepID=A0ABW4CMP6_9LACO|nr:TIM-barrel domain-containing protein [Lacticaseibacillus yichunensis]